MVEVDPNVLLIGTAVVGIALIMSCLRPANKKEVRKTEVVPEVPAPPAAVPSKPKKKSKSKSKSKGASSPVEAAKAVVPEVAALAAPVPAVKVVEVAVEEDASDDDEEERLTPEIFKPAEATKSKKGKETQEQKAARLEREKAKKETKKVQEEDSIYAAALSRQNDFQVHSQASHPSYDGWAVVEGRKLKPKRNESTNDLDEIPSPVATPTPAVSAPTAAAAPVDEVLTPPPAPIDSVTKQLTVEARKLGLLIGPKGVTKIGLQNATGTDIAMPKVEKDFNGPVEISITGTNEGVDRAIFALNEMVVKGYSTILASPDFHEGYVEVKPK